MKILKLTLIIFVFILSLLLFLTIYWDSPVNRSGEVQTFTVKFGDTAGVVGMRLQQQNLIHSAFFFRILTYMQGKENKIQAGEYSLSPSMGTQKILSLLVSSIVRETAMRITIPEGFTAREIAERMDDAGLCSYSEWMRIVSESKSYPVNLHSNEMISLEGFLFPDTYFFQRGRPCEKYIQTMVDRFFEIFTDEDINEANRQGFTLNGIVTLASLVEKEARLAEEREVIAGVLRNRLARDMFLQCDATVQYALPQRKKRLLYEDLEIESPYNTYLHKGLPPGPICNPGEDSLYAALHPADVPYLYYVARNDGSHIFSVDSAAHQEAVMKMRRERAEKQF